MQLTEDRAPMSYSHLNFPQQPKQANKNWCHSANNLLDTPTAKLQKAGENCTALGEIKSPSAKARDHSRAWVTSQTLLLLTR